MKMVVDILKKNKLKTFKLKLSTRKIQILWNWLYVLVMSRMHFRVNPHSIVAWMSRNVLSRSRCKIWSLSDLNWTQTQNHLICKQTLNHLAKWLGVCLWAQWFWVRVQLQSLLWKSLADIHHWILLILLQLVKQTIRGYL